MSPTSSDLRSERFPLLAVLAVLALVAAVFARSLAGELVYDDLLLIARNPTLGSLENLTGVFGRGYWDFLAPGEARSIGYWRPLPAAAHLIAWRLSGESPWALHAVSLAAHLVATFTAARLAWALVPHRTVCLATAALFGLHPVHVESVAWISALNDPLFGAFSMLALAAFAAWRAAGSRGVAWSAAVWFALALLSKEMGAAVLPLAVVVDLARRRGASEAAELLAPLRTRPLAAYGPLLVVLAAYVGARVVVFGELAAGFDRVTTDFGVGAGRLALLRVELLGLGAELLALPTHLQLFRRFHPDLGWSDPQALRALGGVALTLALVVVGLRARTRDRGLVGALLVAGWLVASLSPVLVRVESLGRFPLSDRFLYLAAFAAGLGWSLLALRFLPTRVAQVALVLLTLAAAASSFTRAGVWRDERTLFGTEAAREPRSVYVQWGLGRVLLDEYRRTGELETLDRAIDVYEHAQDLLVEAKRPGSDLFVSSRDYLQVQLGYGWAQLFRARHDGFRSSSAATALFEELAQALGDLRAGEAAARERGIRVRSEYLESELVQNALGVAYLFEGRLEAARRALTAAVRTNPNLPEAHQNLGRLAAASGDPERALGHFQDALGLRPRHLEDALLVAQTQYELGRVDDAVETATALLEAHPDAAPLHLLLAAAALGAGDTGEALRRVDRTLALDPRNAQAFYLRGNALVARERTEEALDALRRATELDGGHFEAHHDLAALLLAGGAQDAAREPLVRAFALAPTVERASALRAALLQYEWSEPSVLFELATLEARREEFDAAEAWLDRGLGLAPDDPDLLFQKGRVLRRRGRDDEALALMRRSLDLVDGFVGRAELGHYLAELERVDEARVEYTRALGLAPPADWPDAQRQGALADVRVRLAELDDAD